MKQYLAGEKTIIHTLRAYARTHTDAYSHIHTDIHSY